MLGVIPCRVILEDVCQDDVGLAVGTRFADEQPYFVPEHKAVCAHAVGVEGHHCAARRAWVRDVHGYPFKVLPSAGCVRLVNKILYKTIKI